MLAPSLVCGCRPCSAAAALRGDAPPGPCRDGPGWTGPWQQRAPDRRKKQKWGVGVGGGMVRQHDVISRTWGEAGDGGCESLIILGRHFVVHYLNEHTQININTYIQTYIHNFKHTCIHTYIHAKINAYIYTSTFIYIHTYIYYTN